MPLLSTLARKRKGLCLLSLDAGGARGVSQLKILAELMHRLNFEAAEGQKLLPCDVFDMIGGSGSGGFIAILLVVLGMNTEQTMEEFIELNTSILEKQGIDAQARTTALKVHVKKLLGKYAIKLEMHLLDSNERSRGCKLVVPISYKNNVGPACMLRNFDVRQEEALNSTIAEAMVATLASPTLFTSTSIFKDSSTFEYISADLTLSNPTRQIIAEAYGTFGEEARIACLLNIGCGHPGIIKSPEGSHITAWIQFLEKLVTDSEQKAEEIKSRMGHLGLYHRFSVMRGLEREIYVPGPESGEVVTHTAVYLTDFEVSRKMDVCVDSLRLRDGVASLEQLQQSGGQSVLPAVLPPLTKHFVMRKKPWDFIENVMLESRDDSDGDEPRMLVVRIRADTIRHVRSLGVAHSQKGFEDCLLFLSQPCTGRPRLILYDNVDDPDIELAPLLPLGESCAIVITSRNRSLGELSPEAHLELDIMSLEEAVDVLLQRSGRSAAITDHTREQAGAIARSLGYLPIALTQARSYMYQTQCSPGEYLERLSSSQDKLLAQPVKYHRDMRYLSTYAAFEASFGLLTSRCQHLLRLLSYFHWNNFPLALVILAAKYNFSDYRTTYIEHGNEYHTGRTMLRTIFLHEDKWDVTELDEMTVALGNHSLITLIPGIGTRLVQMHHLTHGWINSCIPVQETSVYQAAAVVLLSLGSRREHTTSVQYIASHVIHMSAIWDQLHVNEAELFARILDGGGSYEGALQLRERVARELQSQAQPSRMNITDSIWALASSYFSVGRYKDAEPLQREAVRFKTEILGECHPETITASNSLAGTYCLMGRLKEAELLQEEVLKLSKEIFGERHPDTIMALSNLAITYGNLGRLKEAEVLLEERLKLRKEILGERHPDTITTSYTLATIYRDLGRLKEAETLLEEGLKPVKEILGEGHPDTITASYTLATIYRDLGRLNEAETLLEEVVKLRKKVMGEHHPETITASHNLALIHRDLERPKEAELLMEEVVKLSKGTLGERHPDTITASHNLALIYRDLGRLKEAAVLLEEVLKFTKEVQGEGHPDTILNSNNLADCYLLSGRLEDAEALQVETLRQAQDILGNEHLITAFVMLTLAEIYESICKKSEALKLLDAAELIFGEKLGNNHARYLECQKVRTRVQALPDERILATAPNLATRWWAINFMPLFRLLGAGPEC